MPTQPPPFRPPVHSHSVAAGDAETLPLRRDAIASRGFNWVIVASALATIALVVGVGFALRPSLQSPDGASQTGASAASDPLTQYRRRLEHLAEEMQFGITAEELRVRMDEMAAQHRNWYATGAITESQHNAIGAVEALLALHATINPPHVGETRTEAEQRADQTREWLKYLEPK